MSKSFFYKEIRKKALRSQPMGSLIKVHIDDFNDYLIAQRLQAL